MIYNEIGEVISNQEISEGIYKTVFNYVDEGNISSSKWLESLGFTKLHREPKFGVDKIPFNLYVKDRKHV